MQAVIGSPVAGFFLETGIMRNLCFASGGRNRPFQLVHFVSHFRPRDATLGNSFFQMSSYARANLRITNEKTKGKFP